MDNVSSAFMEMKLVHLCLSLERDVSLILNASSATHNVIVPLMQHLSVVHGVQHHGSGHDVAKTVALHNCADIVFLCE
jgi:hypothetical protein